MIFCVRDSARRKTRMFGFLSKAFVKCIDQREFVRLGLMLQNIKRRGEWGKKNRGVASCNVKRESTRVCCIRENKRNCSQHSDEKKIVE